jgi:hypothetical protein
VRIIDGIFGSNDTSRAIATIIALVHRELVQDPDFGLAKAGKFAILTGLTKALTAFAVLQNVTHKRMMKQIPMTVLWEGLVTDEKDELEEKYQQKSKIIQFKNNNKQQENEENASIMQELNALLQSEEKNENKRELTLVTSVQNGYKVTTKTTCTTTKTTTICPLDSTFNKRIIIKTNEEENGSYLALMDNSNKEPPRFILSTLSEKRRKRKIERQEENIDISLVSSIEKPTYHHKRRFSSPDDGHLFYQQKEEDSYLSRKYNYSTSDLSIKQRHASSNSSIFMTRQKRSSSISSFCSTSSKTLSMTTTNNTNNSMQNESTHIIKNIAHYMRYASAAYGESFMRILGIGDIPTVLPSSHHHHPNHHAFAHHTGNSVEDILLSSYTDRSPLHLHNPSIHALVHYVTVDHDAKAIVLTCRGTLGLSDILTDLSFDYTEFNLPTDNNSIFKAHSGMLDAAQLLAKEKGKVYQKIRQGLVKYPDYSLVMCGHSLGGGVASLLCVLWSQKINGHELVLKKSNTGNHGNKFVTSDQSGLPAGRSIHCYAYGPPGVMSLELSQYCTGLVTSVVHGNDIVSSLSLGLLKDFKNVATSLHAEADVAEEIISRVVGRLQKKKKEQERSKEKIEDEFNEDDQWFWAMIKTMRADMTAEKMYPPSTVYLIETIPHVKQQHKVALSRCEDVQARFSEIVFSRTMFMDHSPLMYERAIRKLCRGYTT